ncbi:hypothetical protein DL765_002325 [Monosporascus sp. GIB2]|nr:hypothetical protein DL765_002325 [Monosporascus sp. GIB2]
MALSDAKLGFSTVLVLLVVKTVFIATELFFVIEARGSSLEQDYQKLVTRLRRFARSRKLAQDFSPLKSRWQISLLVPLGRHSLAPVDTLLGAMILDAQNMGLFIQLVAKETLASRWQVVMVWFGQAIGLSTVRALVGGFTATNWLDASECRCFSVFWWAWFTNCPSEFPSEVAPFWMYFGLRCTTVLHGGYISWTKMESFNLAERIEGDCPCNPCQACLGYTEDEVDEDKQRKPGLPPVRPENKGIPGMMPQVNSLRNTRQAQFQQLKLRHRLEV